MDFEPIMIIVPILRKLEYAGELENREGQITSTNQD